jgi:hypothetical protein
MGLLPRLVRVVGLLLPLAALLAFTTSSRPAHAADPLPAEVLPPLLPPAASAIDASVIQQRLQDTLQGIIRDSTLGSGAWACVVVATLPATPRVVVSVQVQADTRPGNEGVYTVTVTLTVVGQGMRQSDPHVVGPGDYGDGTPFAGPTDALANEATNALDRLAQTVTPCNLKGRLKVHGRYQSGGTTSVAYAAQSAPAQAGGLTIDEQYAGDLDLSLQADGSFSTSGVLTMSFAETASTGDGGSCSETGTELNPQVQVSGGYRASDDSVHVQSLQVRAAAFQGQLQCSSPDGSATCSISAPSGGASTVHCTYTSANGQVDTCSQQPGLLVCVDSAGNSSVVPLPAGPVSLASDLRGSSDLAVGLSDGAVLTLPGPPDLPAGFSWDATLTLSYGEGGGQSDAPPTSRLPLAADGN